MALVLHFHTGHVSPQFHVIFDPSFHTLQQDQLDCMWQQLTYFVPKVPKSSADEHKNKQSATPKPKGPQQQSRAIINRNKDSSTEQPIQVNEPMQDASPTEPLPIANHQLLQVLNHQQEQNTIPMTKAPHEGPSLHRLKRVSRAPQHLIELMFTEISTQAIPGELFSLTTLFPNDATMDMPNNPLFTFKATNPDPDTMYHHQAMQQPDKMQFIGAMQKEMDSQLDDSNFEIMH